MKSAKNLSKPKKISTLAHPLCNQNLQLFATNMTLIFKSTFRKRIQIQIKEIFFIERIQRCEAVRKGEGVGVGGGSVNSDGWRRRWVRQKKAHGGIDCVSTGRSNLRIVCSNLIRNNANTKSEFRFRSNGILYALVATT